MSEFQRILSVIQKLRDPNGGCPWDLGQTHESLIPFLIEESYELSFAIKSKEVSKIKEELGDVLLQVLLHSRMKEEQGAFGIEDVCKTLADKMIRRHPHVFGKVEVSGSSEVLHNWEEIKKAEKSKEENRSPFSKELLSLPALMSAYKIGKKSSKVDFDWNNVEEVLAKVEEEIAELKVEIANNKKEKIAMEMGDLLFSVAQLSRHLKVEPEMALMAANEKFVTRFDKILDLCDHAGKSYDTLSRSEKEQYWQRVKQLEKVSKNP